MKHISFTQKDLAKGKELLRKGGVTSILFSNGTYQIEIVEEDHHLWPFLQIGEEGEIVDGFCNCEEKKDRCYHLAAAYLSLFREGNTPLHARWKRSFWNQICHIASGYHGYRSDTLIHKRGWEARLIDQRLVFSIRPCTTAAKEKLTELLDKRAPETEETSLKFSNLSEEELFNFREGRPSDALQYELSFWSDLSKWFFALQEKGLAYEVTFHPKEGLPHWIKIACSEFIVGFYIQKEDLPLLIPSLSTIDSPLQGHPRKEQTIRDVEYDPIKKRFVFYFLDKEKKPTPAVGVIPVGDWEYVPNKGFYKSTVDPLLSQKEVAADKIPELLQRHLPLLKQHLRVAIHEGIHPLHYDLFFDKEANLHIQMYLFEKGDLADPKAAFFHQWVYLDQKGFFYVGTPMFSSVDTVILKKNMKDFLKRYQPFLSTIEGFHVHLSNIESRLSYRVTEEEGLLFYSHIDLEEEEKDLIDFDEWIFLPARGFFPKKTEGEETAIFDGKQLVKKEIPSFIRRHQRELGYVPHFFATTTFLEGMSWKLKWHEKGILVEPIYNFLPYYQDKKVLFFEEYLFVQAEGFSRIRGVPAYLERYLQQKVVQDKEALQLLEHLHEFKPWIIEVDPRLTVPKQLLLQPKDVVRGSNNEWTLNLSYATEVGETDLYPVWQAMEEGKKYLFSPAGMLDLTDKRFHWMKLLGKKKWKGKEKRLELTAVEWARIQAFEGLPATAWQQGKMTAALSLEGLQSQLRPYQKSGVHWLWFLYNHGLSGILCDEMGLGKTHQAMALLAAVMNDASTEKKKYLVVCPTSVIYHWQGLLAKYLPSLRLYVFYGVAREPVKLQSDDYDVILTSYGMIRAERKHLEECQFTVAIYDELQQAKNPRSQIHRALCSLQTKMAVGLTGTPIENRIGDIKALFDLTLPGYFPSDSYFEEYFKNPIEKEKDSSALQRFSRMIKPFVLRRKKSDVLLELPEKEEEIAYCDLSDIQKEMYREAFTTSHREIRKEIDQIEKPRAQMHIFALFSKLKQICDHPCIVLDNTDQYMHFASGKWDLFVELLTEARESGQKVVVFSQYLRMLDILGKYLKSQGIEYAEIRGSTRNRGEQIERFQKDPECEVFLGSLQAAGVGIDLTAASVVIHYDRWWNPAKENQATDRVHRIGQSRGVQVFKLVTKKTIEERIHNLIEEKKGLLEDVVGFDDQDVIKHFTKQELLSLLKEIEEDLSL